ncbi:MAG: PadR family transcriptional regulator [Candidatus Bipolaricaulaceae bacterium]
MHHDGPCCPPWRTRGLTQAWILLALAQGAAHGYELLDRLGPETLDPGFLYRTLRAMEQANLVQSVWDTSGSGPARRVYSLTALGWEELRAWAVHLRRLRAQLDQFLEKYAQVEGGEKDVQP